MRTSYSWIESSGRVTNAGVFVLPNTSRARYPCCCRRVNWICLFAVCFSTAAGYRSISFKTTPRSFCVLWWALSRTSTTSAKPTPIDYSFCRNSAAQRRSRRVFAILTQCFSDCLHPRRRCGYDQQRPQWWHPASLQKTKADGAIDDSNVGFVWWIDGWFTALQRLTVISAHHATEIMNTP